MVQLPPSIFDLLESENFRRRPGMYLSSPTISILFGFITGYFYAVDANDVTLKDMDKLNGFNDFVANHYGWLESTAGWRNIILKESGGDEKKAFTRFFELYDVFVSRTT